MKEKTLKVEILETIDEHGGFSNEEKAAAIKRCLNVVEYLYETASNIVVVFIETQPFDKARVLADQPEELAIKAMQTALRQIARGGRQPGEQVQ